MEYRKIELKKTTDSEIDSLIIQVAKWHNLTPKHWIPDYRASNQLIRVKCTKVQKMSLWRVGGLYRIHDGVSDLYI